MLAHLFIYLLTVLTINLLPGPDMLYIMAQSMHHGKSRGMAAVFGISTGCCFHIMAVSIGLSALIFKSAIAFSIVKYIGAAYLLYLGVSSLKSKQSSILNTNTKIKSASWRKIYYQGMLTNILNPKVALFFMAFLPQFVVQNSSHSIAVQLLILGLIFNFSGTIVNILAACFFGQAKHWITKNPIAVYIQQKVTGLVLIGLSAKLALTRH